MDSVEITTILGPGSSFEGKLTFEGAVRIDGNFTGEIRTEGVLLIGERARVEATIIAANVVVQGHLRGDVSASNGVEIHSSARVHGNLATPSLTVEKGAVFQGNSRMEGDGIASHPGGPPPAPRAPEATN